MSLHDTIDELLEKLSQETIRAGILEIKLEVANKRIDELEEKASKLNSDIGWMENPEVHS